MDITTRFNVQEEVFVPYMNEVLTRKITRVTVMSEEFTFNGVTEVRTTVYYDLYPSHSRHTLTMLPEGCLYKTRRAAARESLRHLGEYVSEDDLKDIHD